MEDTAVESIEASSGMSGTEEGGGAAFSGPWELAPRSLEGG